MLVSSMRSTETTERARFRVDAHCWRCAATLEQALESTDGVVFASIDPRLGETIVVYDPDLITPRDLREAIEASGAGVNM